MIKPEIQKALQQQINEEFYSAYLYLSMSGYFETLDLPGFAHWMFAQYREEVAHAVKSFRYLLDRGGNVELEAISKPPSEWNSPLHVFEETLKHEQEVTERINALVDLSIKHSDHATNNMLQWYVAEQVEEESTVSTIIAQLKRIEGSKDGLFLVDKELGTRPIQETTAQGPSQK